MLARAALLAVAVAAAAWLAAAYPGARDEARARDLPTRPDGSLAPRERERAIALLEAARRRRPDGAVVPQLAAHHLARGDAERAIALLRPLVRAEPENVTAWTLLALALAETRPGRRARRRGAPQGAGAARATVNVIACAHDGGKGEPLHILILTDRDWTHPQAGGTGTHLYGQVVHWLEWGHRVTVIAGSHPGAPAVERPAPNLELRHAGTRLTVFPRAAWLVKRGAVRDVDVVLEVVNGIAFFTPLWRLHVPRVALVYHVHRDMYVEELGRRGAMAAWLLETLPLRHLYAGTPFLTISHSAEEALVELGVAREDITVAYSGVEATAFHPGRRSRAPSLLYLGRIKRYKRLEILLDVLAGIPGSPSRHRRRG